MSFSTAPRQRIRRMRAILFALTMSIAALAVPTSSMAMASNIVAKVDITYRTVDNIPLKLNVYRRNDVLMGTPVLFVHGGGWMQGNRTGGPMAEKLAQAGFVVFTIDYRLTNLCVAEGILCANATAPKILQDTRVAARWIRKNASRYNARTGVLGGWGESAGGHLAELLASPNATEGRLVDAVVAFSGPADLPSFTVPYMGNANPGLDNVEALVGCTYTACPTSWLKYSPTHAVATTSAPHFIVNSAEEFIPVAGAQLLADNLTLAGVFADLRIVDGKQHMPHTTELDTAAMNFLTSQLA